MANLFSDPNSNKMIKNASNYYDFRLKQFSLTPTERINKKVADSLTALENMDKSIKRCNRTMITASFISLIVIVFSLINYINSDYFLAYMNLPDNLDVFTFFGVFASSFTLLLSYTGNSSAVLDVLLVANPDLNTNVSLSFMTLIPATLIFNIAYFASAKSFSRKNKISLEIIEESENLMEPPAIVREPFDYAMDGNQGIYIKAVLGARALFESIREHTSVPILTETIDSRATELIHGLLIAHKDGYMSSYTKMGFENYLHEAFGTYTENEPIMELMHNVKNHKFEANDTPES